MRILYFSGVVPVQLNAGYTLMFRHLKHLRHHEVLILTREFSGVASAQLPHPAVQFPERSHTYARLTRRIGSPLFWLEREAARLCRLALPYAREFRPDLVLTLWATPYLLAAADLAQELSAPLALVFHDDFEQMLPPHPRKRAWAAARLGPIYHRARARICVGPGMVEHLTEVFGAAPADIVYPIPEPPFDVPLPHARQPEQPLRIGFFGELGGNYGPIHAVVDVLEDADAEFHFFSHAVGPEREALARRAHVFDRGSSTPRGLHEYFRANIDVILVPQGFESEHLPLRRTCFPSKLPEACQMGLPLLVVGPADGSAARWGRKSLGREMVLLTLDRAAVADTLVKFRALDFWTRAASRVQEVAVGEFSPVRLHQAFEQSLARAAHVMTSSEIVTV